MPGCPNVSEFGAIASWCEGCGVRWDEGMRAGLSAYADALEHFNRSMNLIGPLDRAQILDELLLDSLGVLGPLGPLSPGTRVVDVGSGAGLPGVPLKLVCPGIRLTCVEPRSRRATFLRLVTHRLGLDGVAVVDARIEEAAGELGPMDVAVSKAFQPPVQWLETAAGLVEPQGGRVVCLTRQGEMAASDAQAKALGLWPVAGESAGTRETRRGVGDRVVLVYERGEGGRR